MKLVLDAFARHCAERPDDAAIVDPDRSALTWSELAVRVAAMRALIAARTAPGARVCVSVPSGSAFWIAVLAAASSGRMPCLLPDPIPGMIADRIPAELGADALLVNAAMVADSARMPPREGSAAEPIGAILLSSGTTGHSRFVVRSVEAIDLIARTLVDEGLSAPGDIVASFLPMAHAYGFEHAFLAPILAGARVHALGAFSLEKATDALAAATPSAGSVGYAKAPVTDAVADSFNIAHSHAIGDAVWLKLSILYAYDIEFSCARHSDGRWIWLRKFRPLDGRGPVRHAYHVVHSTIGAVFVTVVRSWLH